MGASAVARKPADAVGGVPGVPAAITLRAFMTAQRARTDGSMSASLLRPPRVTGWLCGGRRLCLYPRQSSINARPSRRTRRPDSHRRVGEIGIVECPSSNVDQVRSCLCLAEEGRATIRAEPAVHSISAVGHAREIARPPTDLERRGAKADTNRSTASAQVLAIAAPAHPRSDRWFSALPANRTA